MLVRITTPWCCAGFVVRAGRVYCTAPILKGLRGMTVEQALEHCRRNHYEWQVVTTANRSEQRRTT